ncbi:MAG: hypothetical protein ACRCV9_07460 [Burkholderiaceae bacterium]
MLELSEPENLRTNKCENVMVHSLFNIDNALSYQYLAGSDPHGATHAGICSERTHVGARFKNPLNSEACTQYPCAFSSKNGSESAWILRKVL